VPHDELTAAQTAVIDALDEQALVDDLVDLVRVPSITGSDAESELQGRLSHRLSGLGLDVDHWALDLDALAADPDHPGIESERSEGWGLVGTSEGEGEVALVLQGHSDVVPTGDLGLWSAGGPFSGEIRGDVLHGRGACDMKAGVAVNLAVATALVRSGVTLTRRFALHHVISEEDGGLGAFATLRRGHRGEVAVITEPTSGHLVVANAGALTFTLHVEGRAAHGSTRAEGVSALEAFWPVHTAIRALEERRNADRPAAFGDNPLPFGISIGRIRAGDWSSSVPDALTAEGRYGVRLGEDVGEARTGCGWSGPAGSSPRGRSRGPSRAGTPSSTRCVRRSLSRPDDRPRSPRRPMGRTCGSTPASAASRHCTTVRVTSASPMLRASRSRSARRSRWPGPSRRWPRCA
jgi:acetylornithine deacetylase